MMETLKSSLLSYTTKSNRRERWVRMRAECRRCGAGKWGRGQKAGRARWLLGSLYLRGAEGSQAGSTLVTSKTTPTSCVLHHTPESKKLQRGEKLRSRAWVS